MGSKYKKRISHDEHHAKVPYNEIKDHILLLTHSIPSSEVTSFHLHSMFGSLQLQ